MKCRVLATENIRYTLATVVFCFDVPVRHKKRHAKIPWYSVRSRAQPFYSPTLTLSFISRLRLG